MSSRASTLGFVALCCALCAVLSLAAVRAPTDLCLDAPLVDNREPGLAPRTPGHRLLVVLLDGVRLDTARAMPSLQRLAAHETASFVELEAATPTFSAPQYVAAMTGVAPAESGIRTNRKIRATQLESIASRVRATGAKTVALSDGVAWWPVLFPGHFSTALQAQEGESLDQALPLLDGARFALIHWTGVDSASHDFGATSSEARAATARLDADLGRLVTAWGWPEAPVLVLTDHGHLPAGGHGGDEADARTAWLVSSGAGFRRASPPRQPMTAVAATATAILGVASPTSWSGAIDALVDGPVAPLTARPRPREVDGSGLGVAAGLALLLVAALGLRAPRRLAAALLGAATLALISLGFGLWHGLPSFSLTGGHAGWVVHLGLLSLGCALVLQALRPVDVSAVLVLAVSLVPAGLCLALFGAFTPRACPQSGLSAVAPLAAFASGAAVCLGAALGSLLQRARGLRPGAGRRPA